MASSPAYVKLDVDHPTGNNASSTYHPPSQYPPLYEALAHPSSPSPSTSNPAQCLPSAYPSAPPPDYSLIASSKAYEVSNVAGPYPYTAPGQANQLPPQQMLLAPYPQQTATGGVQSQQLVLVDSSSGRRSGGGDRASQPSFLGHFILSCFVFWCCGWMCGGIAFVVALIAQSTASSGNSRGARRLGYVSLGLSICGVIIGTIMLIIVIAEAVEKGE